jgi:hypothetical protein
VGEPPGTAATSYHTAPVQVPIPASGGDLVFVEMSQNQTYGPRQRFRLFGRPADEFSMRSWNDVLPMSGT